jgi:opacity protein-like surface antigen
MKKVVFIWLIISVLSVQSMFSQLNLKQAEWHQLTFGAGSSVWGAVTNMFVKGSYINTSSSTPVFYGEYSYAYSKEISVGLSLSYQRLHYDIDPFDSLPGITINLNRINGSLHAEYYFVQTGRFDMYFGGKLGLNYWWGKVSFEQIRDYIHAIIPYDFLSKPIIDNLVPSDANFKWTKFSYQIGAGVDYFFTDHIGIKGQLTIGSPYWSMIGLNVRF